MSGNKQPTAWLLALTLGALCVGCFGTTRSDMGPSLSAPSGSANGKNVLLVTLDTLRADRLGCYGCQGVETPVIDGLAAGGVRFTDAIAPAPMTLPSHSTILTGLYPPRHGVRDNGKFRLDEGHLTLAEHLKRAEYETGAFIGSFVLDRRYGLGQGFDVYDDQMADSRRFSGVHGGSPQRPGNIVTDAALEWLTTHNEETPNAPLFAWVHLFDAHTPYDPPEPFATTYRDSRYLGEVAFVDHQIGRLVAFLRERSLLDQTLIVIVGDHGEGLGEHNEDTHSRLIYETTMRVPMIWYCPELLGDSQVVADRVVSLADVTPTILDLLGLDPSVTPDGVSLLDPRPPENRAVYIETIAPQLNHGWSPLFGLRRLLDKYIEAPRPEYFDLATDARELRNRYSTANDQAMALKESLAQMRRQFETIAGGTDSSVPAGLEEAKEKLAALGYVTMSIGGEREVPADPKDMMPLLRKNLEATALSNAGRFAKAATLYREILEESPQDGTAWAGLSIALSQQGRIDDAIEAILKATLLQPEQRHWIYLARLQMEKGDDDAFLTSLERAKEVVPADGEIPLLRGEQLLRNKQYDDAMRYFEKAREIDPSRISVSAYVLDGRALVGLGKLAEAHDAFSQALFSDPNDLRALDEMAGLAERNENFEEALPKRDRLCQLRPASMLYANRLSALYFELNRPDDAIAILGDLAEREPGNPAAQSNFANALLAVDRLQEAIEAYRRAIRIDPRYVIARHNLAEALARTGDLDGAMQQFREALAIQPDFTPARHRLLVLLTETDQLDRAISELRDAASREVIEWSGLVADPRLEELFKDPRVVVLRDKAQE